MRQTCRKCGTETTIDRFDVLPTECGLKYYCRGCQRIRSIEVLTDYPFCSYYLPIEEEAKLLGRKIGQRTFVKKGDKAGFIYQENNFFVVAVLRNTKVRMSKPNFYRVVNNIRDKEYNLETWSKEETEKWDEFYEFMEDWEVYL